MDDAILTIEQLIEKVDQMKKEDKMDLSSDQDLSVALMNLISIEEHFFFTGVKTGWKVLDMGSGAGYSTELFARAVGPTGKVYGQNDKGSEKFEARLKTPTMANVTQVVRPFDDPAPPDVQWEFKG